MPVSYEDKIKEQAQQYLEAGEQVLSAVIARPRGATTTGAGGLDPVPLAVARSPSRSAQPARPGCSWRTPWRWR